MPSMPKPKNPPPPGINLNVYPGAPSSTVVVTNTVVHYGPDPQHVICPYCHANITTKVESKATTKTHISALLLCCFLCWPCALVPYCMDSCQNRTHYCPSCNAFLGSYDS